METKTKNQFHLNQLFVGITLLAIAVAGGIANVKAIARSTGPEGGFFLLWLSGSVITFIMLPFFFRRRLGIIALVWLAILLLLLAMNFLAALRWQ